MADDLRGVLVSMGEGAVGPEAAAVIDVPGAPSERPASAPLGRCGGEPVAASPSLPRAAPAYPGGRGPLTADEAVRLSVRLCAAAGLPAGDAEPALTPGTNAVVLIPGAGLVARMARGVEHLPRMRRELALARHLHAAGIPAAQPAARCPCPQLSVVDGRAVTWWCHLPGAHHCSIAQLFTALRALHALPLPAARLDPFAHMPAEIDAATGLEHADRRVLRRHVRELSARYRDSHWPEDPAVLLHGDAHCGNALATPNGVHVIDLEDACIGPWAWDLVPAYFFHTMGWIAEGEFAAGIEAYGRDPRRLPDFNLLMRIKILRMTCRWAALTGHCPHLIEQVRLRIASLINHRLLTQWWDVPPPEAAACPPTPNRNKAPVDTDVEAMAGAP